MMNNYSLKGRVASLEDAIITISGPALAISGIIAGADLVTGGTILRSFSWLTLAWAITLLLTLDFQVLALGVRARRVYASNKGPWQKACEIALMVLIAGAISYVSIQMQAIIARVNAEGVSIDVAAMQLGVNMVWLTWERSSLVLVLIFLSGWLRDEGKGKQGESPESIRSSTTTTVETVPQEQPLQLEAPANLQQTYEPIYSTQFTSFEQPVYAYMSEHPEADASEVMQAVGCNSVKTAEKWITKWKEQAA